MIEKEEIPSLFFLPAAAPQSSLGKGSPSVFSSRCPDFPNGFSKFPLSAAILAEKEASYDLRAH
jgi:hypothetical protein